MIQRDPVAVDRSSYDLVIVGGGVYGVALALEAARRRLNVLLVERRDFGSETSWNSLHIIHGGLRSLQSMDLLRFREMVTERRWWLRYFPDLVEPVSCLMPLYGRGLRRPSVLRSALLATDLLSWSRNRGVRPDRFLPRGRVVGKEATVALCPALDRSNLHGGALWYDGFVADSHRLLVEMLHWATANGAVTLNYVEATDLVVRDGRAAGLRCLDVDSGQTLEVEATTIVNCAGPWCREIASAFDRDLPELFHPSLAFNVLLDRPPLSKAALAVEPLSREGRTYFLVPWKGLTLAGTFHASCGPSRGEARVDDNLLIRFLDDLNASVPGFDLETKDALRVYSGFLPAKGVGSVELALREKIRHHADHGGPQGLFSVSGVKLTTARRVAEKTLREIQRWRGMKLPAPSGSPRPETLRPLPWNELRSLLQRDADSAHEHVRQLIAEESVLHLDDLMLRRTDWAFDPRRSASRADLLAPLFPKQG